MAVRVIRAIAVFLTGLYAGGVLFFAIAPSVIRLPNDAFLRYWQALNLDYRILPPFLLTALALLGTATWLSRRRGTGVLVASALACVLLLASIVITVTQMLPLNEAATAMDPDDIPADFPQTVQRWWSWHLVRTGAGVAAFGSILVAGALDGAGRAGATPRRRQRTGAVAV